MHCYGIKIKSDCRIRYVGMTSKTLETRFHQHKLAAEKGTRSRLYNWMRKHANDDIEIIELETANSKHELGELEKFLIESYRSIGQADMNMTDGGTGGTTPEIIEKVKKTMATPESVALRSSIMIEFWKNPEHKKKVLATRFTTDQKEETKRNRSNAAKKWQADPAISAAKSIQQKEVARNPQHAEARKRAQTPEVIAKRTASIKATKERKKLEMTETERITYHDEYRARARKAHATRRAKKILIEES